MSELLKLHDSDGDPIYVDAHEVRIIRTDEEGTTVITIEGDEYFIQEDVEVVATQVNFERS